MKAGRRSNGFTGRAMEPGCGFACDRVTASPSSLYVCRHRSRRSCHTGGLRARWRTVRRRGAAKPLSWYYGRRHSEKSRPVDRQLGIDARAAGGASTQRKGGAVDGGQHYAPGSYGAYRRPGGRMQPVRKDRAVSDGDPDRAAVDRFLFQSYCMSCPSTASSANASASTVGAACTAQSCLRCSCNQSRRS